MKERSRGRGRPPGGLCAGWGKRPIPAMGGNGALVEPRLHANDHEFPAGGDLPHFRAQRGGRLHPDERISDVTIDFTKILPAAGRQNFFAARKRNAGQQKEIPGSNREGRARAQFCEEWGAPHGAIEQHEQARADQQSGAEEKEHDDRGKVWCDFHDAPPPIFVAFDSESTLAVPLLLYVRTCGFLFGTHRYLINRGSKFSTKAYVNNTPQRSNANRTSATFHIRSDSAIFNTGGFSGSSFTERIDRTFTANTSAKVPRMRIEVPKNCKPSASYRRAD